MVQLRETIPLSSPCSTSDISLSSVGPSMETGHKMGFLIASQGLAWTSFLLAQSLSSQPISYPLFGGYVKDALQNTSCGGQCWWGEERREAYVRSRSHQPLKVQAPHHQISRMGGAEIFAGQGWLQSSRKMTPPSRSLDIGSASKFNLTLGSSNG